MGKEKKLELYQLGGKRSFHLIRHSGVYDLDELVGAAMSFFDARGYYTQMKDHSEAVSPGGKEVKMEWAASRRVTKYVEFDIELQFWMRRQIEGVVQGKKKVIQQGLLEIRTKAYVRKNYRGTFPGSGFGEFLRQTYEKYIVKELMDEYEDKVKAEAWELVNALKEVIKAYKA